MKKILMIALVAAGIFTACKPRYAETNLTSPSTSEENVVETELPDSKSVDSTATRSSETPSDFKKNQ